MKQLTELKACLRGRLPRDSWGALAEVGLFTARLAFGGGSTALAEASGAKRINGPQAFYRRNGTRLT